jgi:membrane protease YdiL (CAAX protease family)
MTEKSARKIFNLTGLALFILIAAHFAIGKSVVILLYSRFPVLMSENWFYWVLSYGAYFLIGFPLAFFVLRKIPNYENIDIQHNEQSNETVNELNYNPFDAPSVQQSVQLPAQDFLEGERGLLLFGMISLSFIINLLTIGIMALVSKISGRVIVNPGLAPLTEGIPLLSFLTIVIIGPIMEELLFRKLLYKKLAVFDGKIYIFVSATLFAFYHINFFQLFYTFALGVVFAWLTFRIKSIRYSLAFHMVLNLLSYCGIYIQNKFGIVEMIYYGWFYEFLVFIGIIAGIIWLIKCRSTARNSANGNYVPRLKTVFLNPGMILFLLLSIVLSFIRIFPIFTD